MLSFHTVPLVLCLCLAFTTGLVTADFQRRVVFDASRALLTARLDPIISPGIVSQHGHRILGASSFNATYNATTLRQSQCTNIEPQADMSNYWHPMVYKVNYNNFTGDITYSPIWGRTRIYYNFPTLKSGTGPGTYIEPFPDDFQMLAGTPSKKTGGGYNQQDLSIFYYHEQAFPNGTTNAYTTYDLPMGGRSLLTTKVWFPSCWNGKPYDPTNPLGHVQYPLIGAGLLGPNCPLGYERRIPGILIETFYIGAEDFGPGPFGLWGDNGPDVPSYILANGDTTGYGLHGDFQNGWNTTVLQQVINQCQNVNFSQPMYQACPPLAPSWDEDAADNCLLDPSVPIPDEVIGWSAPLTNLPGCNLPWGNTTTKPTCSNFENPRFAPWANLVGIEDNETPSDADLATPYLVNGTASAGPGGSGGGSGSSSSGVSTVTVTQISTSVSVSVSTKTALATTTTTTTATATATTTQTLSASTKTTTAYYLVTTTATASVCPSGGQGSSSPPPIASSSSSSTTSHTGLWTSGLPTTTVVISTAKVGGRCNYAAFGTRTVCDPAQTCQRAPAGTYTCATATSSSSPQIVMPVSTTTSHTGIWTSGLPTTTVVISTAANSARCGAAFGTRTVCPPSQDCSYVAQGLSSCRAARTAIAAAVVVDGQQHPLNPVKRDEIPEAPEVTGEPRHGRRLKRGPEAQEL